MDKKMFKEARKSYGDLKESKGKLERTLTFLDAFESKEFYQESLKEADEALEKLEAFRDKHL